MVSDNTEDEQKMAGALETVSMGPSRETPLLPASVPRCAGSLGPQHSAHLMPCWPCDPEDADFWGVGG